MNEHHKDIIEKAYTAFNSKDIEAILPIMDVNVSWPKGWEGEYIDGIEELREFWASLWKELNPILKPLSIKENRKGQIEVVVHQLVKNLTGDLISDSIVKHMYNFENGLIKSMDLSKP